MNIPAWVEINASMDDAGLSNDRTHKTCPSI